MGRFPRLPALLCRFNPARGTGQWEVFPSPVLMLDWFGCLLTGCVLALLLPGRHRILRAALAMLLGEAGRTLLVLVGGGQVLSLTVGGAFTALEVEGFPAGLAHFGGLFLGALLGLLAGRETSRDALLYAFYTAAAALLLPGLGVGQWRAS